MTTQLFQSGGVQTTVILPQIIYLDFDGELTRYNGELLTIDNVTVEDSGLTEERIAAITATLNQQFRDQNVEFVTEKPASGDYSTIFVGKTSSFAPYGSFAGLAETVDSGNTIHNDNAFVMLDSLSSDDRIADVIAHEAGHLLGTLDHGGEGLTKYAMVFHVLNGETFTKRLYPGASMYVSSGGVAIGVIAQSSYLYVLDGGTAITTTAYSGHLWVSSGGIVERTIIHAGGRMYVSSGGMANSTVVGDGSVYISSGGTANSTTVNSGGSLSVSSGGTALDIRENGGCVSFDSGADVSFAANSFTGVEIYSHNPPATLHSGTIANSTTVQKSGSLYVFSGGVANNTTINGGSMSVSSGGAANSTTVNNVDSYVSSVNWGSNWGNLQLVHIHGYLNICGVANNTTINGGSMYVSSGGTANSITVSSGGCLYVSSGGTASNIIASADAYLNLIVASDTYIQGSYDGSSFEMKDAKISNYILCRGDLDIFCGGTANSTTVNSGCYLYVSNGGTANNTTVNSISHLIVCNGGTANSTTLNAGRMNVGSCGTANNTTVNDSGWLDVYSGGTANNTTVNDGGYQNVDSGGTANKTTVNDGGGLVVYDDGTANNTTVNDSGWLGVNGGGTANNTTVNDGGYLDVGSGGKISGSLQINGWNAVVSVYQGAIIDFTVAEQTVPGTALISNLSRISGADNTTYTITVKTEGQSSGTYVLAGGAGGFNKTVTIKTTSGTKLGTVSVGSKLDLGKYSYSLSLNNGILQLDCKASDQVQLFSSGTLVSSATVMNGNTLQCGGNDSMIVSSGGTANSTTVSSGGTMEVSSGGVANSTTVNPHGFVYVSSGGVANSTTVNPHGFVYVSSGGTANSTTVNYGGYLYVSSGGTALAIKENGGFVSVAPDVCATFVSNSFSNLVVSDGMHATLHSGTTANSTTINRGYLHVNGGTAVSTFIYSVYDDGGVGVYDGGTVNSTNVVQGVFDVIGKGTANNTIVGYAGSMHIFSDGAAKNTIMSGGKLNISSGGVHSGTLQITGGAVSACQGAIIDFTVAEQTIPSTALINDWSLISGGANADYTITINADQADGTYVLAGGAAAFDETITVKNTGDTVLGTVTVGDPLIAGGKLYTIAKQDGLLSLSIETMTPITITADSASKTYDGAELTASGYTYTGTLAKEDHLEVTVSGNITDAGTVSNQIASCKVMRGEKDVTSSYTFNDSIAGLLTVNQRNVTINSGSADKMYDGTPLTCDSTEITSGSFVFGEGYLSSCNGSQTSVGTCLNTFTVCADTKTKLSNYHIMMIEGNLTVTLNTALIIITADSASKMYDGTELVDGGYTYTGKLAEGDHFESVTVIGSVSHFGSASNTVSGYKIVNSSGEDVTGFYSNIQTVAGKLEITKRNVSLVSCSTEKQYDGIPLINHNVTVEGSGWVKGEGATCSVTGSQLDVGTSENTFTYTLNEGTKADDYNITTENGTLTVSKRTGAITITADSASKTYDGTALTASGYTYSGTLAEGDQLVVTVEGSITDVGAATNVVTSYKVMRGETDVTANYTFNDSVDGTLTVTKRNVTLTSKDANKIYDGTPLICHEADVSEDGFVSGEGAEYTFTGSQTEVGSSENTFTYTLKNGTKASNYNITTENGTLTVSKMTDAITITADSASKTYDGTALTASGYTYSGALAEGDQLIVTVEGSITDVGEATNVVTAYKVMRGETDVTANYTFNDSVDGTLTVTKRNVTLTSKDANKIYDGTPLTCHEVDVSEDGFVSGEGAEYTFTGLQTEVGSSENTFTYTLKNGTKASNYNITTENGTLTVSKMTDAITITANSASKTYDGTALTASGYTYSGALVAGDQLVVTVEGSITDVGTAENIVAAYKVMRGELDVTANYTFAQSISGKLEVTKRNVTLISNSNSKVYDGEVLTGIVSVGGNGFVEGEATASAESITDAGSKINSITISKGAGYKDSNYNISKTEGTLTVTKRDVTLISGNAEKVYDGTPLTNHDISVSGSGWGNGDGASYTFTGSQTNVGTSDNTFTYTLNNGTKADNYDITRKYGILEVSAPETVITIKAESASRKYDGTELTAGFSYTGKLVEGDKLVVTVTGSVTNVGTCVSSIASYKVMRGELNVTSNYTFGTCVNGMLEVTKRNVTLTSRDANKVYDGTPLICHEADVSGDGFAEGEGAEYIFTGSQTYTGSSENTFSYTLKDGTKADNYNITTESGTLTVSKRADAITITANSASRMYDGTALTASGYTYTGTLAEGDELMVTVSGSQTDAGTGISLVSGYKVMRGDLDVTANYTFNNSVNGTLTVTKRNVTLISESDSKVYDGTPLINHNVTITGDGFAEGEGAEYTFTGSQTEVGSSENTFSYTLNDGTKADNYNITTVNGTLTVTAPGYPYKLQGTEDGVAWAGTADAYKVEYSTDQYQHVLSAQTEKCGIDTFAMPEGSYQWRVRNSDSEKRAESAFTAEEKTAPESYVSEANGIGDIFFAGGSDVWESGYTAEHVGCGTWSGTGEQVELAGKNQITDVFEGSTDANILVMTDDENGDALFVDDIYSAFPEEQQSRIAQLDEIRAGQGDDIVDMTSQRFAYSGDGVTIRGGNGNDVIWANSGDNKLFGDAGSDRIVGASGNDVIAGGTGNDSMHGGGGDDIFCFCQGWGKDTVEQLSDGNVTLWFASGSEDNWDQDTMTYLAGKNSVHVTGVTQVTLKFGDDGSTQYDELLADGAFMSESSEKIWEESGKGVLAKL